MKILFGFLALVACWVIGYLTGSFMFVSFSPSEWAEAGRVLLVIFSTLMGLVGFLAAVSLT